jgi:hypothetical protein
MQDEVNYYKSLMFASSDNSNSITKTPVLTVSYHANTTVPTNTVSVSLCQGAGEDAYLASGTPSTNFGTHGSIGGNTWTCSGPLCLSRGLFKFDLSSIPAGATITNASLQLFADLNWSSSPTTGGPSNIGYLSRVTSSWAENTVTWGTQPNTTAVNQVQIPGSSSTAQNYTLAVTALVQDMVTNTNYGFMLKMQDEVNYYKSLMFASSDNSNSANCPVLTIIYSSPTGIAESVAQAQLNVYPMPFSDVVHVDSDVEMKQVVIYDLLGNSLIEQTVNAKTAIISNDKLPNGIFLMHVYSHDGSLLSSKKIVKAN